MMLLLLLLLLSSCSALVPPGPLSEAFRPLWTQLRTSLQQGAATAGLALVLFSGGSVAETLVVPAAASSSSAVVAHAAMLSEPQQLVSDVWFSVYAQYYDDTFNGLGEDGWRAQKVAALNKVAEAGPLEYDDDNGNANEDSSSSSSRAVTTEAIHDMLATLGDPYTRYLPPEQYRTLTEYARGISATTTAADDGKAGGIGVQLQVQQLDGKNSNAVVTVARAEGPAAAAGVRPGDAILQVNGEPMERASAEYVAAQCRGPVGQAVEILVRRPGSDRTQRISITRVVLPTRSVKGSTFVSSATGNTVGLLQVPSFSQETTRQVVEALRDVQQRNGRLDALVVDLRGNVGGFMPAGVDAAKLFLRPQARIIAEVGRPGTPPVTYYADGIGAETKIPLYLLVDGRTASAAEIFAAALHDDRRALVVGSTHTFGKGRIQNLQSMGQGSGVAVTRARYITPRGQDLHGVGIQPDKVPAQCGPDDTAATCLADIV